MEVEGVGSSSEPLVVRVSRDDDTTTVSPIGDLDLAGAPILTETVEQLRPLTTRLQIHLGEVPFIDSSGLSAILGANHAALADTGTSVRLLGCGETTIRLLKLSGLDEVFDISA